ncbi:MAG: glycosyltransferase family 4 protein [Actinomycetota bacterium]
MTKLKIALVHAYAWPEVRRGGERLVDDLTNYLRAADHRVDVYCGTKGESRFHTGAQGRNYRLHVPTIRALERRGIGRIESFGLRALAPLLLHRYDIVHAFTPTAALAAVAAGQPTVYTVIGHPTVASLADRRLQRTTLGRAVGASTEVAVLSRSAAAALEEAFGRRPLILPPGVPVSRFELNPEPRTGPPRLLFSADLANPDKGLPVLLSAFAQILARHPGARLALSGPGTPDRAFRQAPDAWARIESSVDVLGTGAVGEVPDRYRSAHVTVLPSRDEAFGIVLVESLASGTPVVGGMPGGAEDIITPEVGRLVPSGDVEALATAIDECIALAADASIPQRCWTAARTWDWSVVGPRYEAVYASLAGRRRPPGLALLRRTSVKRDARAAPSAARPTPS